MSKERLKEFKDYIDFLDDSQDMQDHGRFVDTLHSLYEDGWFDWIFLYAIEQAERVQELESFKNSVEYTVDTETIELIVENQDSDVALSSVETYDEEIYFLKKRVEDNDQAIVDLNKHVEELEDENVDLEQQNKRYREFVTDIKKSLLTSEGEDMFFDWLENELENFKDETKHIKPIANEYLMRENKRYREAIEKARRELEICARSAYLTLSKALEESE